MFWFQKTRTKWLLLNGKNTTFFCATTIIRRHKNHILSLQDNEGVWVQDPIRLEGLMLSFYKNLFVSDGGYIHFPILGSFPIFTEEHISILSAPLTNKEVKRSLFSMVGFKGLGSDNFHAAFYQNQ